MASWSAPSDFTATTKPSPQAPTTSPRPSAPATSPVLPPTTRRHPPQGHFSLRGYPLLPPPWPICGSAGARYAAGEYQGPLLWCRDQRGLSTSGCGAVGGAAEPRLRLRRRSRRQCQRAQTRPLAQLAVGDKMTCRRPRLRSRSAFVQTAYALLPVFFKTILTTTSAYAFIVHHCLCREAAEDYLLQRRTSGTCRTPHQLSAMIEASVDLQTKEVDCCRNGCVAFTASREALTQCDVCKTSRYRSDGRAAKKATY